MQRINDILKTTVLSALGMLMFCGFAKVPQRRQDVGTPVVHDSLRTLYLYTEALKKRLIDQAPAEAASLLTEALDTDSTYAPAWYELSGLRGVADPAAAVDAARRAVEADSSERRYWGRYGQMLLLAQRYAEAVPVYEKLVAGGHNPDDYRLLAMLYEQNGRPFSAIAILDSADGQFGSLPPLSSHKRRLLLSTRQFDRALDEACKAVEAVPYAAENHVALGEIYEMRGEDSLARASFERAVQVDSSDLYAWVSLGDYYLRRQNHRANIEVTQHLFESDELPVEDKIDMFRRMTADRRFYREFYPQINRLAGTLSIKYPDNSEVTELYAGHLIASGLPEQALLIYKNRLDDNPPRLDDYTMVTAIESYLGHADSVEYYLDKTLERFPDNHEAYIGRGSRYYVDGRTAEALDCFRKALKLAPGDSVRSEVLGYMGDVYHSRGDRKRCYASYEKALKAFGDNASVLNNYAYYLSLEGRTLDRALAMSKRATELSENNPTYLDTYAWVLYRLGRYEEAKRHQRQAISLDRTDSPELRLHYGDILAALGDNYMAEVYWRRALEAGYGDAEAIAARIEKLKHQKP